MFFGDMIRAHFLHDTNVFASTKAAVIKDPNFFYFIILALSDIYRNTLILIVRFERLKSSFVQMSDGIWKFCVWILHLFIHCQSYNQNFYDQLSKKDNISLTAAFGNSRLVLYLTKTDIGIVIALQSLAKFQLLLTCSFNFLPSKAKYWVGYYFSFPAKHFDKRPHIKVLAVLQMNQANIIRQS